MKVMCRLYIDDKVVQDFQSRSFVKGFMFTLYSMLSFANTTLLDITNTSKTTSVNMYGNFYASGCGSNSRNPHNLSQNDNTTFSLCTDNGIQIGTGTNVVTPTDYALQTQIASGTSATQMEYFSSGVLNAVTVSGSNASFAVERIFRNSSSGSITVNEVGLYGTMNGSVADDHFQFIRDIVSGGQVVADGEYLRVIYTVQI